MSAKTLHRFARRARPGPLRKRRAGVILLLFALLLVVLLGMVGLVVDSGYLMAQQRQAQNAADAAALAGARDLLAGRAPAVARATAITFVNLNMPNPTESDVRIPPSTGPYAGRSGFVEVMVTHPTRAFFIHVLPGANQEYPVGARAVAGFEAVAAGEGVAVLNPNARPGLGVGGGAALRVNGRVSVNSEGGGLTETGEPINNGNTGVAASSGPPGSVLGIFAQDIRVVGGVDRPELFKPFDPGGPYPLLTGQLPEPDPLETLPTPTTALGVDPTRRGAVSVTKGNVQGVAVAEGGEEIPGYGLSAVKGDVILYPGVYESIDITGSDNTIYLVPGIYVIASQKSNQAVLKVTGGTIRAEGVMFYNTGSNFDPLTGLPDSDDGNNPPPHTDGAKLGSFAFNAGIRMRPLDTEQYNYGSLYQGAGNVSSKFNGMLFYQRRRSTQSVDIQGNSQYGVLGGTLYAKWSHFSVAGQGTYSAQFIVGSMSVTGQGDVTVMSAGQSTGRANQVFLVE